ncbi:DUF2284 domain-containing protein [Methanotrichaceae archaeon M04Ac]|uniref:DUF2284 domain-containing protein n=1 Tax=Candidatus Methanocrinis alkalitolerans TaxID=3033395 RepID=A0ABT5XDG0_9EURY|nr:DUF2284 domain-containing protein [Candidatus Methanocrinis alkalitolerans]MCR3884067.1 DUF2284 domain-containing protein [Methanothrix sp.]MDF0592721.1 DUF2284 domain-containing protein [Candidatus Methanocrinis alkalitolerans]
MTLERTGLDDLLSMLKEVHPDLSPISARDVVVADWVRLKCRYGCKAYGKHLGCPPYSPTPEETRKILSEYRVGIIARFEASPDPEVAPQHLHHHLWESINRVHEMIFQLERRAFLAGYYKAFGFNALPCTFCATCIPEEKEMADPLDARNCRHKEKVRPSMEACGIDVFKTLEVAGLGLSVLDSYSEGFALFGLVLLD